MKKTYKMYEAPEAELIEMQMPVVLTGSGTVDPVTINTDDEFNG